ncbi:acetate--CoA ligase family protein [Methanocella conradii]|uniref:acetate--CoA ligase family protein n=1 Tax=Methanocella conradii TaxID=1175444 RepID=UPI0020C6C636|nr:acetate--CoA ligase family protein [Methanocella conradii]
MMMSELEAKALLAKYGIPVNEGYSADSADEAAERARHIGFPVVVKALSNKIIHKSDLGLVELNICNLDGVRNASNHILKKARSIDPDARLIVEAMANPGTEVIVGAKRDPQFGPTVLFGLGGIFVEVFKDVSLRVAPVYRPMALKMMEEIKGYPILKGVRGRKGVDLDALADIIVNTSRLMMDDEGILELDMNPVVAYEKGAIVVDARALLKN